MLRKPRRHTTAEDSSRRTSLDVDVAVFADEAGRRVAVGVVPLVVLVRPDVDAVLVAAVIVRLSRRPQSAVNDHSMMIRYDTRCYFNVRSKADISQLNLPHGCTQSLSTSVPIRSVREQIFRTNSLPFQ